MKETNMEHFRGEIEEMRYAFAVIDGEIKSCDDTVCNECAFRGKCMQNMNKWLMSEYKPEPVLTERENHFVEFVQDGWLAADREGFLYWYELKPTKDMARSDWYSDGECTNLYPISYGTFPFITWEDEEPWSVEELRKLKALEYNPEDVAFKKGGSDE